MLRIPKASKVMIFGDNNISDMFDDDTRSIHCGLSQDLTVDFRSEFAQLYTPPEGSIADMMTIVSNLASNRKTTPNATGLTLAADSAAGILKFMSGKYKLFGLQIWKSTHPLDLSINLEFFSTYNALKQVYEPILELEKMPLPEEGTASQETKDNVKFFGGSNTLAQNLVPLIPPGPSIEYAFVGTNKNNKGRGRCIIDVQIGSLYFKDVFITSCSVTYSNQKMRVWDNTGSNYHDYSISAVATLQLRTIYVITTKYLNDMVKYNKN